MNVDNGHLVTPDQLEDMLEPLRDTYVPVPEGLELEAKLELMGKKETTVGLQSTGSLSRWAKKKREKRKKLAMAGKI